MQSPYLFENPKAKFQPRPYQVEAIANTMKHFDEGAPGVLLRIPTGGGKTITAAMIADEWLAKDENNRVMILAHERQLIWQFAQEIEEYFGEYPSIEMADRRSGDIKFNKIVIASRATLQERNGKSRLHRFDPSYNFLVVLDEIHRWSYSLKSCQTILEWFEINPRSKRLGLSATPQRSDGVSLERMCPEIGIEYRLYDVDGGPCAVRDGYAVSYDQRYVAVDGIDFKKLKEVAGDFRDDELNDLLNTTEQLAKLVKPTLDIVGDRKTLIFSPSVAMAKEVAAYINAIVGENVAESLDGTISDDIRQDTYKRYEHGEFQFLSVCGLCTEGFNSPSTAAVAIYRPTKSRARSEQMRGRGCRTLRGLVDGLDTAEERLSAIAASTKPNCVIVDLCGVTGLGDCATTADIFAEGKPDEVIERANQNMLKDKNRGYDVGAEIRKAEYELAAESAERARLEEEAKRIAEERRKRLLERDRVRRQVAEQRAKLDAQVDYTQHRVQQGGGGGISHSHNGAEMATQKQKGMLRWKKVEFDEDVLTKNMASRVIGQLMKGETPEQIARTNRLTKKKAVQTVQATGIAKPVESSKSPLLPFSEPNWDEAFSILRK